MNRTLLVLALIACPLAPAAAQTSPSPGCEAPEHRALDFWVGEWDAFRVDNNQAAGRSSIRIEDGGCVVTEHWTSVRTPFSGRSLNLYSRESGRWEQYWVDSTGGRTLFVGGPIDNGIQMTTVEPVAQPSGPAAYSRVTLLARPDGAVLQRGETSEDGQTWTLRYAFIYRRRAG